MSQTTTLILLPQTTYLNPGNGAPYTVVGNSQPAAAYYLGNKDLQTVNIKATALTGNMGTPVVKAELDAHIQKFLQKPEVFVSKNVFIVDNDKVDKLERDTVTNEVQHDDVTTISPNQDSGQAGEGINIESSTEIDSDSAKLIQKTQEKQKEDCDECEITTCE